VFCPRLPWTRLELRLRLLGRFVATGAIDGCGGFATAAGFARCSLVVPGRPAWAWRTRLDDPLALEFPVRSHSRIPDGRRFRPGYLGCRPSTASPAATAPGDQVVAGAAGFSVSGRSLATPGRLRWTIDQGQACPGRRQKPLSITLPSPLN